jgi:hypothetical protein
MAEKAVETAGGPKGDAKLPYKQTPAEIEVIKKHGPRLKVVVTGQNTVKTEADHPTA